MSYIVNVLLFLLMIESVLTYGCKVSRSRKIVICNKIAFEQLPPLAPKLRLIIKNSDFSTISATDFDQYKNHGLKYLKLTNDKIKYISPGAFSMLKNLHWLILDNNELEAIPRNAFNEKLKILSLRHNHIRHIDSNALALDKLTHLNLKDNFITTIEREAFKLPRLVGLHLNFNKISSIDKDAFLGLHGVKHLRLEENNIQELAPGLFRDLGNLGLLELHHNKIEKISKGTFDNLKYLHHLNLSNNNLKSLGNHCFKSLSSLKNLDLYSNLIGSLRKIRFKLPELQELSLDNNEISNIDKDAFMGLHSLRELHLKNNSIQELVPGVFRDLSSMRILDLSFNKIEKILEGVFDNLKKLRYLELSQNKLKILESYYFKSLQSLEELDLSSNLITTIAQDTFKLPKLLVLKLNSNNISHIDKAFVGINLPEKSPGTFEKAIRTIVPN